MVWWKWKTRVHCDVCDAKLPTGSVRTDRHFVYVAEGEPTEWVNNICEACWQHHLSIDAKVEACFRRENPVMDVCAQLRDGDPETRRRAAWKLGRLGDRRAVAPLCDALCGGSGGGDSPF
jgi:PBS lyase HEAT-like repeat-containing protein